MTDTTHTGLALDIAERRALAVLADRAAPWAAPFSVLWVWDAHTAHLARCYADRAVCLGLSRAMHPAGRGVSR